jgi:AcrR family transcriptional regulator
MAISAGGAATARDPGPKGLDAGKVVEAATRLTREHGLTGWSMRDLAADLNVATSAIYHHVGDRAVVLREVVAGLLAAVKRADPELDWQEWFEQTLSSLWGMLRDHRGVAHWLMMHGPTTAGAVDLVDAGIASLQRGGFGEHAGFAHVLLLNQVIGAASLADDRRVGGEADGDRGRGTMLADFERLAPVSPGMWALTESMLRPVVDRPAVLERYLQDALRTTMKGLAAELADGWKTSRP